MTDTGSTPEPKINFSTKNSDSNISQKSTLSLSDSSKLVFDTSEYDLSELENYKKVMEQKIMDLDVVNTKVEAENRKLRGMLTEREQSYARLEQHLRQRQEVLEDKIQIISDLNRKQASMDEIIKNLSAETETFKLESESLRDELQKRNSEIEGLRREKEIIAASYITNSQKDSDEQTQGNETRSGDNLLLHHQIELLSQKNMELRAEVDRRTKISDSIKKDHEKLIKEKLALEAQIKQLKNGIDGISKTIDSSQIGEETIEVKTASPQSNTSSNHSYRTGTRPKLHRNGNYKAFLLVESSNRGVRRSPNKRSLLNLPREMNRVKTLVQSLQSKQPPKVTKNPHRYFVGTTENESIQPSSINDSEASAQRRGLVNIRTALERKLAQLGGRTVDPKNSPPSKERPNGRDKVCLQVVNPQQETIIEQNFNQKPNNKSPTDNGNNSN